jgi:hypothetical protein
MSGWRAWQLIRLDAIGHCFRQKDSLVKLTVTNAKHT